MRRFERRGTEAPMDFSYEREDRDLGLFNDAIHRQSKFARLPLRTASLITFLSESPPFAAPSMGAAGRFPNGGGQAFAAPSPFSNSPAAFPSTPTRAMSQQFEPPGSFEPQRTMAYQPPEIQDVSMSSDVPSPQKADDMLVANEDEPPSPSKSKSGKSSGAGKLIRRLMGGKPSKSRGRPEGTSDTERTRRRRRRRDSDSSDNDAEDEVSTLDEYSFSLRTLNPCHAGLPIS